MRIRRAVVEAILEHARADAPLECCGLLIGSMEVIEESYPVTNVRKSPGAFEVDPAGHFAAIRKARSYGRRVVGAYHSHPRSAPYPSETDVKESTDPALLHVIVSLAGDVPKLRAFRITDARVEEIVLDAV